MRKTSFLLSLPLLFGAAARAQGLPAPAPQPVKPTAQASKPLAQTAPTPEPFILENPLPSDSPIVVGEPVRHQGADSKGTIVGAGATPSATSNASVAGISLRGLSDGNAVAKMRAALEPSLKEPVRLVVGDYQYTFLRQELGATLPLWPMMREARSKNGDVPLRLKIDSTVLQATLKELDGQVREDFQSTALNVGGSAVRVKAALEAAPIPASVPLLIVALPKETPAEKATQPVDVPEKAPNGKFPYLLATFSTHYDASLRGRTTNLRMAATHIDGTVVGPGKIFSANSAIGPRDAGSGWREAKMFVSGQVVSGTGAGICQAASTLYNAALLGNFPIVERHAHSMRVMYVPPSRDAALMWGSKDFKFRNTTDGAIKVQTYVSGGQFHVKVWGQTPRTGDPVKIVSRVLSRDNGTKSEAYKIVGDQKIRLSRDSYKPHP